MHDSHAEILYVGGSMRSGSTLLSELLSRHDGAIAIGELTDVWRALRQDEQCSCGEPASTCPVWSVVMSKLALRNGLDDAAFLQLHQASREARRPHLTVRGRVRPDLRASAARLREATSTLLATIFEVTGCRYIIDSTKNVKGLKAHLEFPGVRVHLIHLVRDPRAVVNADRRSASTQAPTLGVDPPERSLIPSTVHWILTNVSIRRMASEVETYQLVRYEDLASAPAKCTRDILTSVQASCVHHRNGGFASHQLVGNPSRSRPMDAAQIHVDDRWKSELGPLGQWTVKLIAFPIFLTLFRRAKRPAE